MVLHFGLHFDNGVYPQRDTEQLVDNERFVGERGLLSFFETHLGLQVPTEKVEHIRTEQYRQALTRYLKIAPSLQESSRTVFYQKSFEADQLACAETLLARRDELLNAGWDFKVKENMPPRLRALAQIENKFLRDDDGNSRLVAGKADRWAVILDKLKTQQVPLNQLISHTPMEFLPPQYRRLFQIINAKLKVVEQAQAANNLKPETRNQKSTDLSIFQDFVQNKLPLGQKNKVVADGSLLIVEAENDVEAAAWLAKLLSKNPTFKPKFLIPDRSRMLDEALVQNGLPAFGLPSMSLGRPTLQLLKLAPAFLWRPLDPYKILEFVTMPVKPLDHDLGTVIAQVMSARPGIGSELWFAAIDDFFVNLEDKVFNQNAPIDVKAIRRQFDFWFDRPTYDITKSAPRDEIALIFNHLRTWASEEFEKSNGKNASLLVLAEQARRIEEYLTELPPSEAFLSFLELERIIRTVYEPAPVNPHGQELGHYPHVTQGSCLVESANDLVWWHFVDTEGVHFFSRFYKEEIEFLMVNVKWSMVNDTTGENSPFTIHHSKFTIQNSPLMSPQMENKLMLWERIQPVVRTNRRLILVTYKQANGENQLEHPLMSHLRACFEGLHNIVLHGKIPPSVFAARFELPEDVELHHHRLGKTSPFIVLNSTLLTRREHETLTSLESLFYYPHQWVFLHKAKLRKSPILSIVKENTLKGNLAHRFFELVLQEDFKDWTREKVTEWVNEHSRRLLRSEAATLLMYGYEPERVQLLRQINYAIWTMMTNLTRNNWRVEATEKDLAGKFGDTPVRGKADLVLLRGANERCVVDLKWSGHGYRERLLRSGEDLQLVLYSRLLTANDDWAHTAYYIMENARLLARNNAAFLDVKPLMPDVDAFALNASIYQKMEKTYAWRMAQIEKGRLEIRTAFTAKELEEHYGAELLDVLEMKSEDGRFDDYRSLIGLIR
jgi:ATP-dependent helicase/nuclease subunit B